MKKIYFFLLLVFISGLFFFRLNAQTTVYLKPEEAIKLLFKNSTETFREDHALTPEIRDRFKKELGYEPPKSNYPFYVGKTGDQIDGYALIDDQIGKVSPITFVTLIKPEGKVAQVEIMVYRESHGGEVTSKRFLNQFKNKTFNDEIRLHGNIVHVTGATLSSQALVVGVKRALTLWKIIYGS